MSARVFLELLLKEYRENHLYVIGNMLNWTLNALNDGAPLEALASLQRSEKHLIDEMTRMPQTTNWHVRDLVMLRAVKKMIEQEGDLR